MFKIGKRSLITFVKRIFRIENYLAINKFFKIHKKPFKSIIDEIFSLGKYPRLLYFNSPTGTAKVNLYSPNDFSTFNLIFCREDYIYKNRYKIVLDIGSNIGLSAIYWLTRNNKTLVYCYEPSSRNFKKLQENLQDFKGRFFIYKNAVSSKNFSSHLNLEESGVYNSLNDDKEINFYQKEKCDVISINSCIEKIIKKHGKIDIVKIDNEGEEIKTVSAIDKKFWNLIDCLNVDGKSVREFVPRIFSLSKLGSAQRYYKDEQQ